jgi:hypothetical protein
MNNLIKKAKNYFIAGAIQERIGNFDVASTNYFKALSAVNDFVLSGRNLFSKDHNERFSLLKENEHFLYKVTSSLFLTYRRAYTNEISAEETKLLKERIKEAFEYGKIDIPTESEIDEAVKKAFRE